MKIPLQYLLRPWIITVVLETAAAAVWGVRRKKGFLTVFLVNTLTNPLLNLILLYLGMHVPYYAYRWTIPCMELLIWFGEGWLFRCFLPEVRRPFLFSACLNGTSYFLGKAVLRILQL